MPNTGHGRVSWITHRPKNICKMGFAKPRQNVQDWITQQWVITFGKRIDKTNQKWLLGPFGSTDGIGKKFIYELAQKENLVVDDLQNDKGLIQSINQLNFPKSRLNLLSKEVIDFYENTSNYDLKLKVKWNPLFKGFGILVKILFSKRIKQLNVPTRNHKDSSELTSDIIQFLDSKTNEVKRTIWLRTFKSNGEIVYSGVYGTCKTPSGEACIKAIFPLPNGNATVILSPKIGNNGELILDSSGKKIGDSGFYFLLEDSKGRLWTKFIKSFKDKLVVQSKNGKLSAQQTLFLWNMRVLKFDYKIERLRTKKPKLPQNMA